MNALTNAALVAGRYWDDGHMDGDWWWMALLMAAFWVAIAVFVVWLVRSGAGLGGASAPRDEGPEEILRRRLAEGSIDVEEYEARLAALRKESGG
ncbi:MAG: SHOCT domain-containing protein [Actinobacteria bacterium]|nr:SHOCT domain-containing protein [Actinomycetota bacterium]